MLDVIAAIYTTAYASAVAGVLIGLLPALAGRRLGAFAAAATWLAVVVAIYGSGGLRPGLLGPIPVNLLPFLLIIAALLGAWLLLPRFRNALMSVPLPALIGLHAGRIGGVFFLLMYAAGRLSAPFAPVAGAGDMIAGAVALALAALLARGVDVRREWIGLWNAFGALDLVTAVALAALSAPGTPFRVFTDGPGTQAMAMLPWALVPTILVPLDFLVHVAIAAKLRVPRARPALAITA